MAVCSNCGSTNVQFKRENVGEVRGKSAKQVVHRTVGYCKDCGYTWVVSSDSVASAPKKKNTWLWVLGWLFVFPVPLTILLVRKKTMNPIIKYAIIAVAWVIYFGIAAGSKNDNTEATATEQNISQELTEKKEVIDVDLAVTPRVNEEDGTVLFSITTNLPEDTELLVTVTDDGDYTAQDTAVILRGGTGHTAEFSNNGEGLKGKYHVAVTMSIPKLQAESVQDIIGKNGEYIGGQYVFTSELNGSNLVRGEFDFEF